MAHREFDDDAGVTWTVWEVHPTLTERRRLADRRALVRESPVRRVAVQERPTLPFQMRHGWLAFRSQYERRRLLPVPHGWEELEDTELRELLNRSRNSGVPRRLVE